MKEEKGKILLQPSFKQQQQTQHIKTNSTTKQHDKQSLTTKRKRTSTMAGLPTSNNFSKTSQGQQKPEEEEEQHQHFFNTPSNLKKK